MNKKIVSVILIVAMATMVYASGYISGGKLDNKDSPEVPKIETMQPTITNTPVQDQTELYLEEVDTNTVQLKLSSDCYGGIGGTENNPPQGTVIDENLTKYYGKTAAKGNGETYIYISGWWFNLTQMMKLPSESVMYGVSPCAITAGSEENRGGSGGDNDIEPPINPIPEVSTFVLISAGIIGLLVLYRKKK